MRIRQKENQIKNCGQQNQMHRDDGEQTKRFSDDKNRAANRLRKESLNRPPLNFFLDEANPD